MNKTLAILGAGIVVGTVVYTVWYKMNTANKNVDKDFENKKYTTYSATFTPTVINDIDTEDDIETIKSAIAQNMVVRHEKAAQIMKNAVDIIYKRREVSDDEAKELNKISNELDELLREE